ncbi:hypothetical protein EVAR_32497_1 [Eumeta japonica]|uniref:Uncharacterized protein n=1 Tax=Eumeta variegata TaxID=151549 RepID=A0A4C1W6J0_EUMVA|nr:hypothetical protein EVAR_32497_1 [Eumeta japonica]
MLARAPPPAVSTCARDTWRDLRNPKRVAYTSNFIKSKNRVFLLHNNIYSRQCIAGTPCKFWKLVPYPPPLKGFVETKLTATVPLRRPPVAQ